MAKIVETETTIEYFIVQMARGRLDRCAIEKCMELGLFGLIMRSNRSMRISPASTNLGKIPKQKDEWR
jgi:hypothetical protein